MIGGQTILLLYTGSWCQTIQHTQISRLKTAPAPVHLHCHTFSSLPLEFVGSGSENIVEQQETHAPDKAVSDTCSGDTSLQRDKNEDQNQKKGYSHLVMVDILDFMPPQEYEPLDITQMKRDNVYSELNPVRATPKSERQGNYQLIDTSQMTQDSVYTDLRCVTANSERPHHYQLIDVSKMRRDSDYAELSSATVDIAVTDNAAYGVGRRV